MVIQWGTYRTRYAGDDDGVRCIAAPQSRCVCPKVRDVERARDNVHVASQTAQPEAVRLARKKSQIADTSIAVAHLFLDTIILNPKERHGITTVDL